MAELPEAAVTKLKGKPAQAKLLGAGCVFMMMGGVSVTLSSLLVTLASRYNPLIRKSESPLRIFVITNLGR